ncbi:mariner Mos1 transposase [Trichonephila clavata]|uniref:Mariner Mos1 transposase n=1 Tax=Trichonephila clavata TaxID=2740835 RepID=A0A8X6KE55_TRICU|nr:mariner Mos1 transposase [Trichonephila clavata]
MINFNQALIEGRPECARRHGKVILLHDNAPFHIAKPVEDTLKMLGWDILPHPSYSSDQAPSGYYPFISMRCALAKQHFSNFEVGKGLDEWFAAKDKHFFRYVVFINYLKDGRDV